MKAPISLFVFGLCTAAFAQYSTGFEASEGYTGSATGTVITGQNGWYVPIAGSADGAVFTYAGNSLGTVVNPNGGSQFLGNVSNTNFSQIVSRAQHDVTFGSGTWTATFDWNGQYLGTPPSTDNLGSFSLQPSTTANYFQTLYHWPDFNNPTIITADYGVADATGTTFAFQSAGAAWQNLPVNHWFRSSTTWDFKTNAIVSVSIQDLTLGGQVTTVFPTGWYLAGGANNVLNKPAPTAVRFFSGGSTNGNVMSYDNLAVGPATTTETLAPVTTTVNLGKITSGDNSSLAGDDGNPLVIQKFFVPSFTSPIIRFTNTFTTTKASPTAIEEDLKAKMVNAGAFNVRSFLHNYATSTDVQVIADTSIALSYVTYTGNATGTLTNYVGSGNAMQTKTEIQQTGPSTTPFPSASFEFLNLKVTG